VKFFKLNPKGGWFSIVLDLTLNGENMRFWLTFFIGFVFAHFLSIWHEEDIIRQLKAWSFRIWKNLVHTQSNSDTIARWSSITFFLYTLYIWHFMNISPKIVYLRLWRSFSCKEKKETDVPFNFTCIDKYLS
jgi:hypothetical protein